MVRASRQMLAFLSLALRFRSRTMTLQKDGSARRLAEIARLRLGRQDQTQRPDPSNDQGDTFGLSGRLGPRFERGKAVAARGVEPPVRQLFGIQMTL